jgi:hypothetical protein
VVLILAAAVWGVASPARPGPTFQFLSGFQLVGFEDQRSEADGLVLRQFFYVRHKDYVEMLAQVSGELKKQDWIEAYWSVDDPRMTMFKEGGDLLSDARDSVLIYADKKFVRRKTLVYFYGDVSTRWNSIIYATNLPPPNRWDKLWSRFQNALHL